MTNSSNSDEARTDWDEARPRASRVPDMTNDPEARGRASSQSSNDPEARGRHNWEEARGFLRQEDDIDIHGAKLPHWNQDETYVFLTFRLCDSIPQQNLEVLKSHRDFWLSLHPQPWDVITQKEYHKMFSNKVEEWIDRGYGSCILKNQEAASIVLDTLRHSHGVNYHLAHYVIMPNHVHVLVRLIGDTKVETIMQEWKSVSSHKLRKRFGGAWCGWMKNYFDRTIRNEEHLKKVLHYILKNYRSGGILTHPGWHDAP